MKGCPASVVTRELQKHTHNELTRDPPQSTANSSNNKCFGVCKLEHLHIMGIQNSVDALENNVEFLKKLRIIIR